MARSFRKGRAMFVLLDANAGKDGPVEPSEPPIRPPPHLDSSGAVCECLPDHQTSVYTTEHPSARAA